MNTELGLPNYELSMSDDDFSTFLGSSSKFLPRVQLFTASTNQVKKKLIVDGHYGIVVRKDEVEDIGEEPVMVPLDVRLKAMDMNVSPPEVEFDKNSARFAEIKEASKQQNSKCMWGPDFLVWIPDSRKFATFTFGSETARNESGRFYALLKERKAAQFGSRIIENGVNIWTGPTVTPYNSPLSALPNPEVFAEVLKNFKNPTPVLEPSVEEAPPQLEEQGRLR